MKALKRTLFRLFLLLTLIACLALASGESTMRKCKAGTCCDFCLDLYLTCIDNGTNPYACQLRYNNCANACGGCE